MKAALILFVYIIWSSTAVAQVFDSVPYYKKYAPAQLRQDLDFLFKKFEDIHPDYFKETPRDTVLKRYHTLKASIIQPMTRLDFMNLFAPVVFNVIKDGHNFVYGVEEDTKLYTDRGGKYFPFPVKIRNRRLYVNSTMTDIPFNSEIVRINRVSAKEVIEKILNGYSGESDEYEEGVFSNWFNGSYWTSYGGFNQYEIDYITKDDIVKSILTSGKSQSEIDSLRIASTKENYRFYEIPELETGVIEYNACEDLKNFRPFCDSTFSLLQKKNYKSLVIDVRSNIGGTTRLNDVLFEYLTDQPVTQFDRIETKVSKDKKKDYIKMNHKYAGWFKWYNYFYYPIYIRQNASRKEMMTARNGTFIIQSFNPKKPKENPLLFEGNIYLLAGRKTYSSAACLVAAAKHFNIATIIGQETGEPTCFTADWVGVELPNTKLKCAISSKRLVLAGGQCDGKGVIPDHTVDNSVINENIEDLELKLVKQIIQNKRK